MEDIQQWTSRGNSGNQHDKHNRALKINNEMKITFVFVYRNYAMFAGNINNCVIICNRLVPDQDFLFDLILWYAAKSNLDRRNRTNSR